MRVKLVAAGIIIALPASPARSNIPIPRICGREKREVAERVCGGIIRVISYIRKAPGMASEFDHISPTPVPIIRRIVNFSVESYTFLKLVVGLEVNQAATVV